MVGQKCSFKNTFIGVLSGSYPILFFFVFYITFRDMGAAVSAGETNDELVDHLVEAGYIRSKNVELLLKAIDRAHFFDAKSRHLAYRYAFLSY